MKRIISVITALALALGITTPVFADDKITADEVKEMYESRMLLSRQDICSKILNMEVMSTADPLAGNKKVSEYINPNQALIYTADTLVHDDNDDLQHCEMYCIHAWNTDDDRRRMQNLIYIEIPVEKVEGKASYGLATMSNYHWNTETEAWDVEAGIHGFPLRYTDYEETAKIINQENDKGKVTSVYCDPVYDLMVTVDGVDYRVLAEGTYFMHGLHTIDDVTAASMNLMNTLDDDLEVFMDKKRALTPNLSEVEKADIPCEPTHYLDEYKNAAAPFADIEDKSKNMIAAVALLKDKGIINGFEDNTFRPNNTLTRGEAATILAKLVRGEYDAGTDFPDTENHWSRGAVNYLVSADIIHGYEDGLFRPDKDISYYEAVNLVMSIIGYTGAMFRENTVSLAMNEGFLDGLGSFTNETPIPRIEFARLIANAYDKNMYVVKIAFKARVPAFIGLADITLGQYYEGQELVNGILFHTPTACQQWQNDYEDEYYILYDSILDEEEKEIYRINKAKRQ